jgi:hypothetical protein
MGLNDARPCLTLLVTLGAPLVGTLFAPGSAPSFPIVSGGLGVEMIMRQGRRIPSSSAARRLTLSGALSPAEFSPTMASARRALG